MKYYVLFFICRKLQDLLMLLLSWFGSYIYCCSFKLPWDNCQKMTQERTVD